VQRELVLEEQEEIHVDVELLEALLVTVSKAAEELSVEFHCTGVLVAKHSDQALAVRSLQLDHLLILALFPVFFIGRFNHGISFELISGLPKY